MLAPWAVEIADRVDLERLRDRVVQCDIEAAFPDRADSEALVSGLRASVTENLATLRLVLNGTTKLEEVQLDRPVLLGAIQAQLRIPQSAMQHSYRVGFNVMWEEWSSALVEQVPEHARDELAEQVVLLTRTILAYQNHVALQVAERHNSEELALAMSRTHVRHRLVENILRDPGLALSPADLTTIGYSFEQHHVAVLLPNVAEGMAARLAASMADAVDTRSSLVWPRELTSSVVWVGRTSTWGPDHLLALRRCLDAVEVKATMGNPVRGLEGFRESLTQALEVEEIRRAWGPEAPNVLSHRQIGLESLLLRDRARAERFVSDELGELAADTREAQRLRETLQVSYRLGSHVATAAHLHVHEHTVRNRLRKVESLLGRPLTERSTEVQVALRLAGLL